MSRILVSWLTVKKKITEFFESVLLLKYKTKGILLFKIWYTTQNFPDNCSRFLFLTFKKRKKENQIERNNKMCSHSFYFYLNVPINYHCSSPSLWEHLRPLSHKVEVCNFMRKSTKLTLRQVIFNLLLKFTSCKNLLEKATLWEIQL